LPNGRKKTETKISQIYLKEEINSNSKEGGWEKLGLSITILDDALVTALAKLEVKTESRQSLIPWSLCLGLLELTKDSQAMNLIKGLSDIKDKKRTVPAKKKDSKISKKGWFFLLGLIFVLAFFLTAYYYHQISIDQKEKIGSVPLPTAVVSPTSYVIDKKTLKIRLLNGSGTTGLASRAAELLLKKGYQDIQTGNANRYDYQETVVQANDEKN
jgi:hypothetical protein